MEWRMILCESTPSNTWCTLHIKQTPSRSQSIHLSSWPRIPCRVNNAIKWLHAFQYLMHITYRTTTISIHIYSPIVITLDTVRSQEYYEMSPLFPILHTHHLSNNYHVSHLTDSIWYLISRLLVVHVVPCCSSDLRLSNLKLFLGVLSHVVLQVQSTCHLIP